MNPTILVVDDDLQLRMIFARALREAGYQRVQTMGSAEAVESVLDLLGPTHLAQTLILMDVSLKVSDKYPDGCAAGRAFARRWPAMRLLFMTGHGEGAFLDRCPGHPPFIIKPISIAELCRQVAIYLQVPPWRPPAGDGPAIDRRA